MRSLVVSSLYNQPIHFEALQSSLFFRYRIGVSRALLLRRQLRVTGARAPPQPFSTESTLSSITLMQWLQLTTATRLRFDRRQICMRLESESHKSRKLTEIARQTNRSRDAVTNHCIRWLCVREFLLFQALILWETLSRICIHAATFAGNYERLWEALSTVL